MYLIMYFMLFSDKPCSHRSKANVVQQDRNRTFGWWEQGLDCADVYTRNGSVFIAIQTSRADFTEMIARSTSQGLFLVHTNFCFSSIIHRSPWSMKDLVTDVLKWSGILPTVIIFFRGRGDVTGPKFLQVVTDLEARPCGAKEILIFEGRGMLATGFYAMQE